MGLALEKIAQKLHHYHPHIITNSPEFTEVEIWELVKKERQRFDNSSLYCLRLSELISWKLNQQPGNFICIQDELLSYETLLGRDTNLIVLRTALNFEDVISAISNLFYTHNRIGYSIARTLRSLLSGKSLDTMVDIASSVMGNPIFLFDTEARLLTKSDTLGVERENHYWKQVLQSGSAYAAFNPIEWDNILSFSFPRLHKRASAVKAELIFTVQVRNEPVAVMAVLEHRQQFTDEDFELCVYFGDLFESELKQSNRIARIGPISQKTFISDILSGDITDSESLELRAAELSLPLTAYNFVLACGVANADALDKEKLCDEIEENDKNVHAFYFSKGEMLLILISGQVTPFFLDETLHSIEVCLAKAGLSAGLSPSFTTWNELRARYALAEKAFALGNTLGDSETIYKYDDYQIYHFLGMLEPHCEVLDFVAPICHEMLIYDRLNGTDYTNTLFHYIQSAGDTTKASKLLHIHRSTVFYRLDRLQELFHIDIRNESTLRNLTLSFSILRLKKLL